MIRYVTRIDFPRGHAIEVCSATRRYGVMVDMTDEIARNTFVFGPKEYMRLKHRDANYELWKGIWNLDPAFYRECRDRGIVPEDIVRHI